MIIGEKSDKKVLNRFPELSLTLFHRQDAGFLWLIDAFKHERITKFLANVELKSFSDRWVLQILLYSRSLAIELWWTQLGAGQLLLGVLALVWERLWSWLLRENLRAGGLVWETLGWRWWLLETVVLLWRLVIDGLGIVEWLRWALGLLDELVGFGGWVSLDHVGRDVTLVELLWDLHELLLWFWWLISLPAFIIIRLQPWSIFSLLSFHDSNHNRLIGLPRKTFQLPRLIIGDIAKPKRLILSFLNKAGIRSLFWSDKLIQTGGGFSFSKGVAISLKLTCNETLADYGVGARVWIEHLLRVGAKKDLI